VSGAKNAALPLLFATLLSPGPHRLGNLPRLRDITTAERLLAELGAEVDSSNGTLKIATEKINSMEAPYELVEKINSMEAPYELVRTMRASVLVLGPLLARYGKARVSLPGGCAIGARPINLHLKGLEAMGAEIHLENGYVEASAARLEGARIHFDVPTVGGTENLMMAATLARGTTILENAAREPEIIDLANALRGMGASIEGAGTDTITIEGVDDLSPMDYQVMPDRIEAGTFLVAAAMTGGRVGVKGGCAEHMEALLSKLEEAGATVAATPETLWVEGPQEIQSVNIKTQPHPGFPTDMQAQYMAMMTLGNGTSMITEAVFENRFMHVSELQRMGADISIEGHTAAVKGVSALHGAPVMATDLRASACLVLAGLAADNTTEISRIYHLDRGYENLEDKFRSLGADIERVPE
jgi:UDP-N-acetylglucosamine 1-carboxyvinyltransferase